MKKPTVLLYACCVMLSFAASFLLDLDDPRTGNLRQGTALPEAKSQIARSVTPQ